MSNVTLDSYCISKIICGLIVILVQETCCYLLWMMIENHFCTTRTFHLVFSLWEGFHIFRRKVSSFFWQKIFFIFKRIKSRLYNYCPWWICLNKIWNLTIIQMRPLKKISQSIIWDHFVISWKMGLFHSLFGCFYRLYKWGWCLKV